jgi:endonuclease III
MQALEPILQTLESFYGEQAPRWPTDPYLFLVWWHCGYPPSEERCTRGWQALKAAIGVSPWDLASARSANLARALKDGGMVPEIRAARLRSIAKRVREEFAGNLRAALQGLPEVEARKVLKTFPGIGAPGADRILLFDGLAPVAAVPSNSPHVLVRIVLGREPAGYTAAYAQAHQLLTTQVPATIAARSRAYLLLQQHGRELCKRKSPRCGDCPVSRRCAYFASLRREARRRRRRAPARKR